VYTLKMFAVHLGVFSGYPLAHRYFMAYPSKTNRIAILDAAIAQVEQAGLASLSLRALAKSLNLAPNALYRYFADRAHLEAAIANEGAARLHRAMALAAEGDAEQAIRGIAQAYVAFANAHPALYNVLMKPLETPVEKPAATEQMWAFVVGVVSRLTSAAQAPEAAVALWAFLHGLTALEQVGAFSAQKPRAAFAYGLDAFLAGLTRPAV
jgi:AcrR family transcriptional regulator